jgi:pentatricopeptide repeat protein
LEVSRPFWLATRSLSIKNKKYPNPKMENEFVHPDLASAWYSMINMKIGQGRKSEEIFQAWRDMREEGVLPTGAIFHTMLSYCKTEGYPVEFFLIFDEARRSAALPGDVMFNMAIYVAAKYGRVEQAFELAGDMKRLGLTLSHPTYGSLLFACSRFDDFDRAMSVMRDMATAGLTPNPHTLTELINSCATKENLEQADSVLRYVMDTTGGSFLAAYNCWMGKSFQLGYPDMGMKCYNQLIESGETLTTRTYFSMIKGCVLAVEPQFDLATKLFEDMKARGLPLDPDICELLLRQAQEPQRLDAAISLLNEMMAADIRPAPSSWYLLFTAFIACTRTELVCLVWDKMGEQGVNRSIYMCRQYKMYCQLHLPERMSQVRKVMEKISHGRTFPRPLTSSPPLSSSSSSSD